MGIRHGDPHDAYDENEQKVGREQKPGETPFLEIFGLEIPDFPLQQPYQEIAQHGGYYEVQQHHHGEADDHDASPLAVHLREIVFAVFVLAVPHCPLKVRAEMQDHPQVIVLPVDENPFLHQLVTLLGIFIAFLESLARRFIIFIILLHVVPEVGEAFEKLPGIEEAAVAILPGCFAQVEIAQMNAFLAIVMMRGMIGIICMLLHVGRIRKLLWLKGSCQRIQQLRSQAVRDFHQGRRQNLQSIHQLGVPLYLHIQIIDYVIVRHPAFFEAPVLIRHLMQGIGQVERKILLLRI